jgi:hypothetical protein
MPKPPSLNNWPLSFTEASNRKKIRCPIPGCQGCFHRFLFLSHWRPAPSDNILACQLYLLSYRPICKTRARVAPGQTRTGDLPIRRGRSFHLSYGREPRTVKHTSTRACNRWKSNAKVGPSRLLGATSHNFPARHFWTKGRPQSTGRPQSFSRRYSCSSFSSLASRKCTTCCGNMGDATRY